jgi:hypothetical protein
MKKIDLKNAVLTMSLLLTAGYSGVSSAHDGSDALALKAGSTDVYTVTCSGGSTRLDVRILDITPLTVAGTSAVKLSALTLKDGVATNTTDFGVGDSVFSPWTYNKGGDGDYTVMVNKNKKGDKYYQYELHCYNGAVHTATVVSAGQDQ